MKWRLTIEAVVEVPTGKKADKVLKRMLDTADDVLVKSTASVEEES